MPKESVTYEDIQGLADLFRHAADPTRLSILLMLLEGELCVCAIADNLSVSVSAVSHQLRILRSGGLVARRRQGRHVYYSLADGHVKVLISVGLEHVRE